MTLCHINTTPSVVHRQNNDGIVPILDSEQTNQSCSLCRYGSVGTNVCTFDSV
jgi:hypothetical protein